MSLTLACWKVPVKVRSGSYF